MAFNWRKFPWTNLHDLNLDWIIQTVKTLEENLADAVSTFQEMINKAITNTLTGSGDLTINKTGDVNITGNRVIMTGNGGHTQMIGGAVISDGSEQLALHNPNSKTSMTANYNNGVLTLSNNQQLANGVAVYPINTPADGGGDNSTFAANAGYVKDAVAAVSNALTTETENRTSGDAALQSTINNVIIPRLDSLSASSNSYVLLVTGTESTESNIALTSEQVTALQNAAQNNYPITIILRNGDYYTAYYPILIESTSMLFGKVNNSNSLDGHVDVNQALGRIIIARVNIQNGTGTLDFMEFNSGLARFLPCSISITWVEDANSYTLTDNEYAILRQSLLDKRPIFIVRNTADAGGEQTTYMLQTCATPSVLNVDSMTLVLQGPSNSIKVQMASKTIVRNIQ